MFDFSNAHFQLAAAFVNDTASPVFLTGRAGTGKTTFLNYIRTKTEKKMAIVAPTGVAAINAGGVTMHSFFQLPFGSFIPGGLMGGMDAQLAVTDHYNLIRNLKLPYDKKQILRELELLVIDEVSMVRADTLDAVDVILRHFRNQPHTPFGGVQLLFIGDLFQLPPVVNRGEWEILKAYYNSPFFFDAHAVKAQPPLYLELKKIYRQNDHVFIEILNNIRTNSVKAEDLAILHERYDPGFSAPESEQYIVLTSHNSRAEAINRSALAAIPGKKYCFNAVVEGDFSEKALPAEMNLELKEGAQIMFIKNDKGESRKYFNGKIGMVSRISEKNIYIRFSGQDTELELGVETWKNIRYRFDKVKNKIEEEEVGSFMQFPIRLAWAITIHKSQGLTFDKAIIDAGESFAPGQVYVALSRLVSLSGLVLSSRITKAAISTDPRIVEFSRTEQKEDRLSDLLQIEKKNYREKKVLQLFDWSKLILLTEQFIEEYPSRVIPQKADAHHWAAELLEILKAQQEIAGKFIRQLGNLRRQEDPGLEERISERIDAAVNYFASVLNDCLNKIDLHIELYKVKKKAGKYLSELYELSDHLMRKKSEIRRAARMHGITDDRDSLSESKSLEPAGPESRKRSVPAVKIASKTISLELFKKGHTIEEVAEMRSMTPGTIQNHLITFLESGEILIEQLVEKQKLDKIKEYLHLNSGAGLNAIRGELGDQFSFAEIKAARQYLKFTTGAEKSES